jgi:hypothetical protein
MEDACRLEVSKNESLFRSNSGTGGPSVLDILQNQLCPSNCSNNGYCNMSMYDTSYWSQSSIAFIIMKINLNSDFF